jgi:hypothetical protein
VAPYACLISGDTGGTCYALPPADYGSSLAFDLTESAFLFLGIQFFDENGQSVLKDGHACISKRLDDDGIGIRFDRAKATLFLDSSPSIFNVLIGSTELQADKAKKAVLYPFFRTSAPGQLTGRWSPNVQTDFVTDLRSPQISDICAAMSAASLQQSRAGD